jgi:hypothetical protein
MGFLGVVPGQPLQELLMSNGCVGEDLTAILALSVQESHIEFGLGHVDTNE